MVYTIISLEDCRIVEGRNSCSLDPRPSDLCILMEGLVSDDHVA